MLLQEAEISGVKYADLESVVFTIYLGSLTVVFSACHGDDDAVMQILLGLSEGRKEVIGRLIFYTLFSLFSLVSNIYIRVLSRAFPSHFPLHVKFSILEMPSFFCSHSFSVQGPYFTY